MKSVVKQYLVLGLGRFGKSIAQNLCRLGHEVMAVDSDEQLVEAIAPYVTQAVTANATDEAALESLGIHNFDAAIVSIGDLRDSILVTVLCKEAGVPCVLAKASDELHAKVLMKVGADRVVFPERDMGQRVARSLVTPNILDLIELADDYQIAEIVTPSDWCGHTLMEMNIRRRFALSVIAIHRTNDFLMSPGGDTVLEQADVLLVLGKQKDIDAINRK